MSEPTIARIVRDGEMEVHFQPIVDLKKKKIYAYEALARPKRSDFPKGPAEMFEEAARYDLAGALGRIVRGIAVERSSPHPLFLNIHPSELNAHFLVQPDDPIFNHTGDVYLEITEGVPLSHLALCKQVLGEVRGRGIYLVVDDLGAGYSNLKYIADLHPKVVKLDRELICGLTSETRLHKLVKHIVIMCRDLDAKVVAEGVETEAELEAIRDAGVELAQGYLFARPSFPPPEPEWPRTTTRPPALRPSQRPPTSRRK